jgi:hypothetical protein
MTRIAYTPRPKTPAQARALAEAAPKGKAGASETKRRRVPRAESEAEESLAVQLRRAGIGFMREHRFDLSRRWRFDFVLVTCRGSAGIRRYVDGGLAVEVEGGVWTSGRHTRGKGFVNDAEKYAHALALGWRVLRCPAQWVHDGTAMKFIRRLL